MTEREDTTSAADAELVLRSRSGDSQAFAELWRRHYRSGIAVARSISPTADPDDLVQEAYTRIFHAVQRGGGPTGSFRAYLFTSIRNTAADWGRARRETTIDELESVEDPSSTDAATAESLDRSLTHQAFRSLPSRWQEVLWYSEIEGMKPAQIAPLLGLKPTAVAQLAFRAREGLREAWVQAHLGSVAEDSDCAWVIDRLGAYARENLSRRDRPRLEEHLTSCARCMIVASEAQEVSSRLALVLIPLTIGVGGAAGYLATLQTGVPVIALATMPSAVVEGAVSATGSGAAGAAASGAAFSGTATSGAAASGAAVSGAAVSGSTAASVAAGTAATAGAASVAGGALSAGIGLAAAVALAGSVAVGVVLPQAGPGAAVPPSAVAEATNRPAPEAAERSPGPSPSDVPGLPRTDDAASDTAQDASPESPVALSGAPGTNGNANGLGNGNGGANGNADVKGNAGGNGNAADKVASGSAMSAGTSGNANGAGNGNAGGAGSGNANANVAANGNANGNGNGNDGLPGGSPSVASSSSQTSAGATVVELVVGGAPGATVEARIRGTVHATAAIGADGRAVLTLRPSAQDLKVDARVDLRYVDGNASGPPLGVRLSSLL